MIHMSVLQMYTILMNMYINIVYIRKTDVYIKATEEEVQGWLSTQVP